MPGASESWRSAKGELRAPGGNAWLVADKGDLWLSLASPDAREYEVVPVTATIAMALCDGTGGTALRRDGGVLKWSRPGGGVLELRTR